ncbi:MAG: PilZ domain-containing protein [Pseudomonadota bacterium]
MTKEKRRFSRILFNVRARLAVGETVHTVERIVNLSVGGCQLEIDEEIQLGVPCKFTILLPRMGPGVEVFGEVIRSGNGEASLKFTKIDPENLLHLQNIIRYNAEDPDMIEEEIKSHPGLV